MFCAREDEVRINLTCDITALILTTIFARDRISLINVTWNGVRSARRSLWQTLQLISIFEQLCCIKSFICAKRVRDCK